ncbi:uncharacterized protein LOC129753092 [Uranotaenia lowii]|uniref:uncharacterized protein LOC129753092 n=1 Tax=Uranotaenia lowii TaxID=190385 RepID=UPI002479B329|nr:uncharacterized protein LOC129753092 [Uranotaenia lowii]
MLVLLSVLLLLRMVHSAISVQASSGCRITLGEYSRTNRLGIILHFDAGIYRFKEPLNGIYEWNAGESIFVGCGDQINTVTCSSNGDLTRVLNCSKAPKYFWVEGATSTTFGTVYQIGFKVGTDTFLPLYKVSYDKQECTTRYSEHTLIGTFFGDDLATRSKKKDFSPFLCKDLTEIKPINDWYSWNSQKEVLHGNQNVPNQNVVYELQRGHLTPDRDIPDHVWKRTTYTFANVVPMYRTIHSEGGNWWKLEELANNLIIVNRGVCTIYTGGLNVPEFTKNYLSGAEGKIAIPHWLWKVVKCGNAGFVAFVLNRIEKTTFNTFCTQDQLSMIGYTGQFKKEPKHGRIHFCKYADVRHGILPAEASFTDLLRANVV